MWKNWNRPVAFRYFLRVNKHLKFPESKAKFETGLAPLILSDPSQPLSSPPLPLRCHPSPGPVALNPLWAGRKREKSDREEEKGGRAEADVRE